MTDSPATRSDWAAVRAAVAGYPVWQVTRACRRAAGGTLPVAARRVAVGDLLALWLLDPDEATSAPWLALPAAAVRRIPA